MVINCIFFRKLCYDLLWEIDKRFCLESYSQKNQCLKMNLYANLVYVPHWVYTRVIKILKLMQLIMTMLIWFLSSCFFFQLKKFHSVEFSLFEKKISITGTIFSHSRSEHNFRKAQEIFLLFEKIRTSVLIVLNFGSCPI